MVSSDVNTDSKSKNDDASVAIEKYKDHSSIKMIQENVLFESAYRFKEIWESDTQKEVSYPNSEKARTFGDTLFESP